MAFQFIRQSVQDGALIIRMCRAPVNVLHAPMMAEIAAALDEAEGRQDVLAAVITGHGMRVFSGGVEIADHSRERIAELTQDFARLLRRVQAFPLPTIAALNGATLGGGLELALACDMMVATPDAMIGHPEIKLASIAFPGILMLQGRLPYNRIVELLASGEPMDGTQAHQLGLVNRLLRADAFEEDMMAFVRPYTRLSRPVLALMMRTLKESRGHNLDTGFDAALRISMDELLPLEDVTEGLAAYAQKRAPAWRHR